mgnify:CR=1 FL=1
MIGEVQLMFRCMHALGPQSDVEEAVQSAETRLRPGCLAAVSVQLACASAQGMDTDMPDPFGDALAWHTPWALQAPT